LIEYYNLHNVEVFLMHGSQSFKFIEDVKLEYEAMMLNALTAQTKKDLKFKRVAKTKNQQ
jgi:hypothetical protein